MSRRCTIDITPTGPLLSYIYCEINHAQIISQVGTSVSWTGSIPDAPSENGPACELEVIAVGVTGATYKIEIGIDGDIALQSQVRTLVHGGRDIYQATL